MSHGHCHIIRVRGMGVIVTDRYVNLQGDVAWTLLCDVILTFVVTMFCVP